MTTVVGLTHGNYVYIGADSLSSDGWRVDSSRVPKVFHNGPYIIGYTDSWRMGQLLYSAELPAPPDTGSVWRFMAHEFIDAVRAALKAGGWAKSEADRESGGRFLVAARGELYAVQEDYSVTSSHHLYDAAGHGYLVALGALHATQGWSARRRVTAALKAAEAHTSYTRQPFTILRQRGRL